MAKKKNPTPQKFSSKKKSGKQTAIGNWQSGLKNWWQSKAPVARFSLAFFGMTILFYILWFTPFFKKYILGTWNELNAFVAAVVLKIFGYGTSSSGQEIFGSGVALDIQQGCDALEPTALFIIGVIASPATVRSKLRGILYGGIFLLGINFFRIISLFLVKKYWPAGFEFMHIEFWQVVFILLGILTWAYWLNRSIKRQANE